MKGREYIRILLNLSAGVQTLRGGRSTYDGYFAAELVLNVSFFECIWAFLPNDLEEVFDTHDCSSYCFVVLRFVLVGVWL